MSTASIDHISINDDFWIQLKEHLISFGFRGLPKGIRLTIAFNDNSLDINFHLSKNTEQQTRKFERISFAQNGKHQEYFFVIGKTDY